MSNYVINTSLMHDTCRETTPAGTPTIWTGLVVFNFFLPPKPFFFFRQTLMKTTNLIFKNGSKRGSWLKQKLGPQALHSHYHLGLLSYLQGIPKI